jgi:DNA-directed RNA polymerase subunit RPC12/RpoP
MNAFYLTCVQCSAEFVFTEEEADRYSEMGFDPPQRCPACRRQKRKDAGDAHGSRHNQKKRDYNRKYT